MGEIRFLVTGEGRGYLYLVCKKKIEHAGSYSHLMKLQHTDELQWLEHLWNHENMFETGGVRANEC